MRFWDGCSTYENEVPSEQTKARAPEALRVYAFLTLSRFFTLSRFHAFLNARWFIAAQASTHLECLLACGASSVLHTPPPAIKQAIAAYLVSV